MKGMLRTSVTVHCAACGSPLVRKLSVMVENNAESIEAAKIELKTRAMKPYTCRICKSIID
jgi:hypothetical protein